MTGKRSPGGRLRPNAISADEPVTTGSVPPPESRGLTGIALALVVLDLLGVPILDWIRKLFKEISTVPAGAIVGGVVRGKELVRESYTAAEAEEHELKEQRRARRGGPPRRWHLR